MYIGPLFPRAPKTCPAMLNSGVREGGGPTPWRVAGCHKWCRISFVNSKGHSPNDGAWSARRAQVWHPESRPPTQLACWPTCGTASAPLPHEAAWALVFPVQRRPAERPSASLTAQEWGLGERNLDGGMGEWGKGEERDGVRKGMGRGKGGQQCPHSARTVPAQCPLQCPLLKNRVRAQRTHTGKGIRI